LSPEARSARRWSGLAALFFFVSGFCGLLYQVVWLRLAFASFGVVTGVLSVVVSVFMLGLFAGTRLGGFAAERLAAGRALLALYGAAELAVAAGAFAVPGLFKLGEAWLLRSGASDSAAYLAASGAWIALSLFPWCLAMGATLPLMLGVLKARGAGEEGFSGLYLANSLGALAGVGLSAVVLIEWLGLSGALRVAAYANLSVGMAALVLALSQPPQGSALPRGAGAQARGTLGLDGALLFLTGFCSMAMEVAWTRAFTPVLLTQVYSFALVLAAYLLATVAGSWAYRRALRGGAALPVPGLLAALIAASLLPILVNDPRHNFEAPAALASILPFCFLLGWLTPMLVDRASGGRPGEASRAYALNILGCVLGPLAASYLLLPHLGVKAALVALALPLLPAWWLAGGWRGRARRRLALAALTWRAWTYEFPYGPERRDWVVRRDTTATVTSSGSGMNKRLLVNGVGITDLTTLTKVMAHLPLAQLDHAPRRALMICFVMGTTFRSLGSWGIEVTAVELVPSVRDAFGYYHDDAAAQLARPGARVVIDDGRRFLARDKGLYDVVTLDPPPPVEAAGSSLLYSNEFYALVKRRLAPGGVLQQWIPEAESATTEAAARSLTESFAHVRMFRSHADWGFHFLASDSPLPRLKAGEMLRRLPPAALADLEEWEGKGSAPALWSKLLSHELNPARAAGYAARGIRDDRPFNEYFLLRRYAPSALKPR
jgi:predicted membrane-bound spermidine synthase